MPSFTIKTTLVSILSALAIAMALFSYLTLSTVMTINGSTTEIAQNWLPSVAVVKDVKIALAASKLAYASHITSLTPETMKSAEQLIVERKGAFKDAAAMYIPLISSERERAILDDINSGYDQYVAAGEVMLALSRQNKNDDAVKVYATSMEKISEEIAASVAELININMKGASAAVTNAAAVYDFSVYFVSIAIGAIGAMVAGATVYVIRRVCNPIKTITGFMGNLAKGVTGTATPFAERSDEVGMMAAAVEVFRENALSKQRLEQEAVEQRNLTDEERRRNAEVERAKADAMAQATTSLGEGLTYLAQGDLTFRLAEPFAQDFERLRGDFNAAIAQLAETMDTVAHATGAIDGGSREISTSADDLSKRTEQQAAALEETAAALDQITVNVANSSNRAEEARAIAVQANDSAAESGKVVANAVQAMSRIEQSSNQIANIIGVIDEIAFQTNLLALNAGVEAARAGDAGKGFAVVAQEVRELAQRSAKAAKEIKELIRNSSAEVQNGVKLVSETGDSLKTIEGYIVTVNQHMDSIAKSAKEQSLGLAEVNTAVNQMDQVTQQNAAMVEETSAASSNLAAESSRLREMVAQFKLGHTLRPTAPLVAAGKGHRPVASPAHRMTRQLVGAFSGGAAVKETWEEF